MATTDNAERAPRARPYEISPRRVKDLPEQERPREVFARDGAEAVSDRVLLSILLRTGTTGVSVVEIADRLIEHYGSLTALAQVSADDLQSIKGIGRVKAQILKAALELARRLAREGMPAQALVRTPEDAAQLLRSSARLLEQEVFWVLVLDTRYRLRRPPIDVTQGLINASLVHPREVFREAVRSSSAAVVLVHNHPSGDPTPSSEDLRITRQLVEAGKVMDIEVLDHVILGRAAGDDGRDFVSLRESGLVNFNR